MTKLIQRYPALRKTSLKGLHAFESAYLHRNFATAANELSVTASAISHSILSLESVLGVHLFVRGKKGAIPTEAGKKLYALLKKSFTEIDFEMQLIIDKPAERKFITLQSPPSFAQLWILPRLPDFMKRYPEIDLRLRAVHEPPDYGNNVLDIAITYGNKPTSSLVISEPIMPSESYVPMCSPSLAKEGSLKPWQITKMNLVHCETTVVSWSDWTLKYSPNSVDIQHGLYLDRSFMAFSAALDSSRVCLDSTLLARDYLKDKRLIMPFGELGIQKCAHYLCVPKQKLEQEKIQKLLSWIQSWLP